MRLESISYRSSLEDGGTPVSLHGGNPAENLTDGHMDGQKEFRHHIYLVYQHQCVLDAVFLKVMGLRIHKDPPFCHRICEDMIILL